MCVCESYTSDRSWRWPRADDPALTGRPPQHSPLPFWRHVFLARPPRPSVEGLQRQVGFCRQPAKLAVSSVTCIHIRTGREWRAFQRPPIPHDSTSRFQAPWRKPMSLETAAGLRATTFRQQAAFRQPSGVRRQTLRPCVNAAWQGHRPSPDHSDSMDRLPRTQQQSDTATSASPYPVWQGAYRRKSMFAPYRRVPAVL
jgi:hypothetical protein